MRVFARITPGPLWRPGRSVYGQGPVIEQHLAFMRRHYDHGTLLLGGPSVTGLSGIAVLEVPGLEAAKDLAQSDPAVVAGVLAYQVEEIRPFFDAVSGARASGTTAPVEPGSGS